LGYWHQRHSAQQLPRGAEQSGANSNEKMLRKAGTSIATFQRKDGEEALSNPAPIQVTGC
jgi:hypothetical protein